MRPPVIFLNISLLCTLLFFNPPPALSPIPFHHVVYIFLLLLLFSSFPSNIVSRFILLLLFGSISLPFYHLQPFLSCNNPAVFLSTHTWQLLSVIFITSPQTFSLSTLHALLLIINMFVKKKKNTQSPRQPHLCKLCGAVASPRAVSKQHLLRACACVCVKTSAPTRLTWIAAKRRRCRHEQLLNLACPISV